MRIKVYLLRLACFFLSLSLFGCVGKVRDNVSIEPTTGPATEINTDTTAEYIEEDNKMQELDMTKLPLEYLNEFKRSNLSVTVGGASADYTARYVDGGVAVKIEVKTESNSLSNFAAVNLQSVNSIMESDRRLIRFICYGNGNCMLMRHLYSEGKLVNETLKNATKENDSFYYSFAKNDEGYSVEIFASYEFLHSTEERSFGEIRILPMLREDGVTATYNELCAYYANPETWPVLDSENIFVRDDLSITSFAEGIPHGSKHKNLEFLGELATITPGNRMLKLMRADVGMPLFSDRCYSIEEHFFPKELVGTSYLYAPIAGSAVRVVEDGYVVLAVSENSTYDALNKRVVSAGFEPIMLYSGSPMNNASYRSNPDLVNWYVKYCKKGDIINFGKWAVPFAKGECGVLAWEDDSASLIRTAKDMYYAESERNWNGCPTVAVTNGGRLFAGWVSGGTGEPRVENYDVMTYSDDGGKTWTEIGVIDTYKNGDKNKQSKANDVQMWLDPDTNTLYVFYVLSGMQSNFEKNSAVWVFTIDNPDAPKEEWNISKHWYCFPGLLRNNITVLSDGTWLAAPNNYMDGRYTTVYESADRGVTWKLRGKAYIPQALNFDETVITELSDGTLWMTVRTARKAIYQSFSFDKGVTWTIGTESEFANPSTRFQFFRTHSGALCAIWNDSPSSRIDLKVAVSYDEGKTWTDPLMIYTDKCSYPDFSIGKDGTIHIVFDSGRYKDSNSWKNKDGKTCWGAIYHIALTEERIASGGAIPVSQLNEVTICTE